MFCQFGSFDEINLKKLFNCVNLNNLSVTDLQRLGRVCRELCKKLRTNADSDFFRLETFREKVVGKCLKSGNLVPNIPIGTCDRVPHRRSDTCFSFTHRFHGNLQLAASNGKSSSLKSPKFEDKSSKVK